jgi:hypothetical protein
MMTHKYFVVANRAPMRLKPELGFTGFKKEI